MTGAERSRLFRKRQRRGLAVWRVEVADHRLAEALISAGLVDQNSTDIVDYERAAAKVLGKFTEDFSATRYGLWLAKQDKLNP